MDAYEKVIDERAWHTHMALLFSCRVPTCKPYGRQLYYHIHNVFPNRPDILIYCEKYQEIFTKVMVCERKKCPNGPTPYIYLGILFGAYVIRINGRTPVLKNCQVKAQRGKTFTLKSLSRWTRLRTSKTFKGSYLISRLDQLRQLI